MQIYLVSLIQPHIYTYKMFFNSFSHSYGEDVIENRLETFSSF